MAFMKGSKFSWDSSWYFPAKDMVTGSEGEVRGSSSGFILSTPAWQSLTPGVSNYGRSRPPLRWSTSTDKDRQIRAAQAEWREIVIKVFAVYAGKTSAMLLRVLPHKYVWWNGMNLKPKIAECKEMLPSASAFFFLLFIIFSTTSSSPCQPSHTFLLFAVQAFFFFRKELC